MIVDFIEVKRALEKTAHLFLRAEIRKRMPFVSQLGVVPQHEGSDSSYETVDRQVQEIDYQLTTSEPVTLTRDEMTTLSLGEVEQLLLKLAEDLAHKIERTALEMLELLNKHAVPLGTEEKYFNTVAFYDSVVESQQLNETFGTRHP